MGLFRAPDNIVRKLKAYDPDLSVEWNDKRNFWEIFYFDRHKNKRYLVTPVTESIYLPKGKLEFTPLDEKIIAWLYCADTWKAEDKDTCVDDLFNRELRTEIKRIKSQRQIFKDLGKDTYNLLSNFYVNRQAKKNPKHPKVFNKKKQFGGWVRPDVQANYSRMMYRSKQNVRLKFGR